MDIVKFEAVEKRILDVRGEKVILDSDVAELYGVETKRVNEAVKNNPDKFPEGYIIALNKKEWDGLKSKFSTSIKGGKVKLPSAFTEKGLYMLATILKSPRAVQTTIAIIETFARIRNLSKNIKQLSAVQDEGKKQGMLRRSGEIIAEILDDDLVINGSETSIELNFAVLKFRHSIKKKKR
jgi:phage regulator Rha-like protein